MTFLILLSANLGGQIQMLPVRGLLELLVPKVKGFTRRSYTSLSGLVRQNCSFYFFRRYIQAKVNEGHEKRTLTENDVSELKQVSFEEL